MAYFLPRENFNALILLVFTVFLCSYYLILNTNLSENKLFTIGLIFRLVFIVSLPFLSQDFYRFIWDGKMISLGFSPYELLPKNVVNQEANFPLAEHLFNKMGNLSAEHFSNYPPINQLFFYLASFFSDKNVLGSVIFFKIIIISADVLTYVFSKKILLYFKLDPKKALWYFLNPLVIIELTGNLHFEGLMLFFLVLAFWYLINHKIVMASVFMALSISTKLLPLLLLPLFFNYFKFKKSLVFYGLILFFVLLTFLPFISSNLIHNFSKTIGLWFVNFEFNASFYYIFRAIGYQITGYNTIHVIGKIIPLISVGILLILTFYKKNSTFLQVNSNALLFLTIYFLLSTTVHPWYIINLLILAVFTTKNYVWLWSFLVFLSYNTYANPQFKENYYLITLEYAMVMGYLIFEWKQNQIKT